MLEVPTLQTVNMIFLIMAKKIRALRYPIVISLMINSSSIFSTLIFRLAFISMTTISEYPDIPATTHVYYVSIIIIIIIIIIILIIIIIIIIMIIIIIIIIIMIDI